MRLARILFLALFLSGTFPLLADETSDWYDYAPLSDPTATALDLSFLNGHPAGGHGFVTVKDGHFTFADGTRARFWGADLAGSKIFMPHERADTLAKRLSKLGVNLLRLHAADTSWARSNFFDPSAHDTLTLDPGQVDKFDYLVAALKKNGIYIYADWLALRKFRSGDGVPAYQELGEGAKGVVHFDPRVIELTQLYAKQVLGHPNPYTGMALKDDPVYLGSEIDNESSLFCGYGEQKFPPYYQDELQKLFEAWGGKGPLTRFKWDWGEYQLIPTLNAQNAGPTLRFLRDQMTKTNLEMRAFLSHLSPHALLAGSNMGLPVLGSLQADSVMDFMDAHTYADLPSAKDWSRAVYSPISNSPQLSHPFSSMVFKLSNEAVLGKPFVVSEWNECFPNEYRLEAPVFMAVYGCLQDWDALLQYEYALDLPGTVPMNTLEVNRWPENEPVFQAGALLFRCGLLGPARTTVTESLSDGDVLSNGMKSGWLFDHRWLPFAAKVGKVFTGDRHGPLPDLGPLANLDREKDKRIVSSTGEISLDYGEGILGIDSPGAQGFTGAIGSERELHTAGVTMVLEKRDPWASVLVIALDGKPLAKSGKFVVMAAARSMETGESFYPFRKALSNLGTNPIRMQGVRGKVWVLTDGGPFTVVALDQSGNSSPPLKTVLEKGWLQFSLSPSDRSFCYLIQRSAP